MFALDLQQFLFPSIFSYIISNDMQKSQGSSSCIDRREIKHSLLDSSDRDESNGSRLMSLGPIDEKLFAFFYFHIFTNISLSIDLRDMKQLSLDHLVMTNSMSCISSFSNH